MVLLAFLVLCACWSTTWYAIRLCLQGYPPLWGGSLRFLIAALLMAGLWRAFGKARKGARSFGSWRGEHAALAVAGAANGLCYACIYLAEQTISGGTAAVISASSPFFTAIFARLWGLEPIVPRRLLGVTLGFFGVTLMMAEGHEQAGHLPAMLLILLASAVLAPFYGAVLKRHACAMPPLKSCTWLLAYTGLTLFVLSLCRGEPLPITSAPLAARGGLLYLAVIGSVVAWTVYLWLLQRLDLTVLAAMGLLQPVLALAVDFCAGDVQLRPRGLCGAALVVLGVALAALRQGRARIHRMRVQRVSGDPARLPSQ